MRSDTIYISNDGTGIAEALRQTESVAVFKSLSKTDSIRLLLLTEEMTGMMKALTGKYSAVFWIEAEDDTFCLHLKTETQNEYRTPQKNCFPHRPAARTLPQKA